MKWMKMDPDASTAWWRALLSQVLEPLVGSNSEALLGPEMSPVYIL